MVCLLSVDCPRCSASSLTTLGNVSSARGDYYLVTPPQRPSVKKRGPRVTGCLLFLGLVFGSQLASPFGAVTLNTPDKNVTVTFPVKISSATIKVQQASGGIITPPTGSDVEHYASERTRKPSTLPFASSTNSDCPPRSAYSVESPK